MANAIEHLSHPYPFTVHDLDLDRLVPGAQQTLDHFLRWRDTHSGAVADHIGLMTCHLSSVTARFRRRSVERAHTAREIVHFAVFNMAEIPAAEDVKALADRIRSRFRGMRDRLSGVDLTRGATGIVQSLEERLPVLRNLGDLRWLAERLDRLYRCLPEAVVAAGGMGKVVRTMLGVLLIGAYDTRHATKALAREHLQRILPAAYAYGAAYAIVDDTLHDLPGAYLSEMDRQTCHDLIVRGLTHASPIDPAEVPDHPLAEELHDLHLTVTRLYPRRAYPHLYQAAESMYQAQHRDSSATASTDVYRFLKAGLSRVVANILGRHGLDDGFYTRCLNTIPASQWRDDLIDHEDDQIAGRHTPFTVAEKDRNPLYELFAYNAYVLEEVFGGAPVAVDALTYRAAGALARYLSVKPGRAQALAQRYETTPEMSAFLRAAGSLSRRAIGRVDFADQQVKRYAGRVLGRRDQNGVEVRTFVADRMAGIESLLRQHLPRTGAPELDEVVGYAIAAPGKRLRPAMSLMLAEGLGADPGPLGPALAASEFLHTASLLFDDLPAQDNANRRRGRPAAHLAFDEGTVQLAALSMIFHSFGLIARLDDRFPAAKVTEVLAYLGAGAGPRLCRGQSADLRLGRQAMPVTAHAVVTMYSQKTSTAVEAALIPIMILHDRPAEEIALVRQYAHHAGIVFQIQDDILDATSTPMVLGKDTGSDVGRVNLIRSFGIAAAQHVMDDQLMKAITCCRRLPFDTRLLQAAARYFATRVR